MNVLFICTHNRCRSVLSEVIFNQLTSDGFQFFSAGSQPVGQVHPLSIKYLGQAQFDPTGVASQSWNDFADAEIDVTITVCDSAANEVCPIWMGNALKLHWPLADPSKIEGSEEDIRQAFMDVINQIKQRVAIFMGIDFESMSKAEIKKELQAIA